MNIYEMKALKNSNKLEELFYPEVPGVVTPIIINDYTGYASASQMVVGDSRFVGKALTIGSTLTSVKVKCSTIGTGAIIVKLMTKNADGTFAWLKDFPYTITAIGDTDIPINEVITLVDTYAGIFNPVGGAVINFQAMASPLNTYKFTGEMLGASNTPVANTTTTVMCVRISTTEVIGGSEVNHAAQNNRDLDAILKSYSKDTVLKHFEANGKGFKPLDKLSLCNTMFPSLPSGWLNPGAFTFASGLKSPATGTTATQCYWDIYSTLDRQTIRARVKITSIVSVFALFKRHTLHGGLGLVSFSSMNLKLYRAWTGGALPVETIAQPITIPIISGREYIITLTKDGSVHSLSIQDTTNGASNSVSFDNSTVSNTIYNGKAWGGPGVMFLSGDITVKKFEFICNAPKNPKVLILGDSITEGFLLDNGTANYEDRWCAKIRKKLSDNCMISGRGSGDAADLITKLAIDLDKFTPQYVILAIGTNDVVLNHNVANFQTNLDTIITRVEAVGAIPILVCPPTNAGATNMTELEQVYAYVNAKQYPIIHFNYATSVGHDGITHDTSCSVEGTHPNKKGHLQMFEQAMLEVPEIFE